MTRQSVDRLQNSVLPLTEIKYSPYILKHNKGPTKYASFNNSHNNCHRNYTNGFRSIDRSLRPTGRMPFREAGHRGNKIIRVGGYVMQQCTDNIKMGCPPDILGALNNIHYTAATLDNQLSWLRNTRYMYINFTCSNCKSPGSSCPGVISVNISDMTLILPCTMSSSERIFPSCSGVGTTGPPGACTAWPGWVACGGTTVGCNGTTQLSVNVVLNAFG